MSRHGYFFVLLHWLMALASVSLLGLGWWAHSSPTTTPERAFLVELHVSLGVALAVVAVLSLAAGLLFGRAADPQDFAAWRKWSGRLLAALIYLSIFVLLGSGYLRAVFAGTPLEPFGVTLPAWSEADEGLAQICAQTHAIAAIVLGGLILVHIGIVVAHGFRHPGFAGRMSPLGARTPPAPMPTGDKAAKGAAIAKRLAGKLRLFGWLQFWLQFVFAFLSALLLQFATSGRALSAVSAGMGDAIYWASGALALLLVTCALGVHYARAAKKLCAAPPRFLERRNRSGFWFLSAGVLLGFLGIALSFVGVALSISLLIAKTVSQPPGIAITDPNKIIRALDVFVLLVNFGLLMAHFLGASVALWLQISAAKSRVDYPTTPEETV